jgi:2,3-bisphosphoglycerate-independent phosphoglycerate mutase
MTKDERRTTNFDLCLSSFIEERKGMSGENRTNRCVMADAVRAAYRAGQDDEKLEPIVLVDGDGAPIGRIQDGDYVIFYDLRGEREIQLTQSFTDSTFDRFPRPAMRVPFVTMIEYDRGLDVRVAFLPSGEIKDTLPHVVAAHGLRQAKVVESEKSVHLTYYLNGKNEGVLPGEDRFILPSPHVHDYGRVPELNAAGVGDAALDAIANPGYRLVTINFANTDVVGHVENPEAIKTAVHTVDTQIGRVIEGAREAGVTAVVTADHGSAERWYYPDGAIDTGHTDSPVPFILVDPHLRGVRLRQGGALTDVAPTVLRLLGLPIPEVMTGSSLILDEIPHEARRVALVIADGWGARDEVEGNLIAAADTPVMDRLQAGWPTTRLGASGEAVGMPPGTVGNSEAGHLHIGGGRRFPADRVRVDEAIADGSFFENEVFLWAMRGARRDGRRLHLLGIISFYSSHGSVDHLKALMQLARDEEVPEVYIHGMLGRRGERPKSGALYVEEIEGEAQRLGVGQVVSIIGRFWALDREGNWDRIEKTYRWLVYGEGRPVS